MAAEAQAGRKPGIARARTAAISASYLAVLKDAEELRVDAAGNIVGSPTAHVLNLFDDANVRAVKLDMRKDEPGNMVWRGAVVGGGEVTLAIDGEQVTGTIRAGARTFRIQPGADSTHRVIELNAAERPRGKDDALRPPRPAAPNQVPSQAPQSKSHEKSAVSTPAATIRLLVVYTEDALADVGNINSEISVMLNYTNAALSNSQTNVTVSLAGTALVNYNESNRTMNQALDDLTEEEGDFGRIQQLRGNIDADLVQLWIGPNQSNNLCGLAWLLDRADEPGTNLAFEATYGNSVVTTDFGGACLTDAAAHEIGHNLGASHDRFVEEGGEADKYSYGYVDLGFFRDIMAYTDECDEEDEPCPLIQYFSNPDITFQGRPIGVAAGQPEAANSARRIGEIAQVVSTFDTVIAAPQPLINVSRVSSTLQVESGSFLRFHNTSNAPGTVTLTLRSPNGGAALGQWTSQTIPAGAELQFGLATIENESTPAFTKPSFYSVSARATFTGGYMQHVLFSPSDGTLTNLSTCSAGVTADPRKLSGVHSAIIGAGFPSSVVINNTSSTASAVMLGIYDARNGTKLGTYPSDQVPGNGQLIVAVSAIESRIGFTPTAGMFHYVVLMESTGFSGFLQHLVNNVQQGVITDMTTLCTIDGFASTAVTSPLRGGAIFSSAQLSSQSFVRFHNTGTAAGTVTLTARDFATGQSLGQWTSPSIAPDSEQQFFVGAIENDLTGLPANKPAYYSISVQSNIDGYFQHVLYRPLDGTLTNLSTCGAGITADTSKVGGVHTSVLSNGFPSSIVVNNTGTQTATVALGIYDARNGTKLGTHSVGSVPGRGHQIVSMQSIEASLPMPPTSAMFHYVVKAEGTFTGFLQHLVDNQQAGVITDMTTACVLP